MRIVFVVICAIVLGSCGIPSQSVLFFSGDPPASVRNHDIPDDWKGRLVLSRAPGQPNETGGAATHVHALTHQHYGESLATEDLGSPLGVREVTADATHRHKVESVETSPAENEPAENLPLAFGLNAVILDNRLSKPVEGLIVGHLSDTLPAGWVWCDGNNGTPDLRNRYILLDDPVGPSGSAEHSHAAPHKHRWATSENVDHAAYFGDPATTTDPSLAAAQRVHRHAPGAATASEGTATSASNAPLASGLRFIMASPTARKLPDDVVVAYSGRYVPNGWRALDGRLSTDILGRLLKADNPGDEAFRLSGSASHDHLLRSRHVLTLLSAKGTAGRDRIGQGPLIPTAGHTHRVVIEDESRVAPAEAFPRYVALLLIVKD